MLLWKIVLKKQNIMTLYFFFPGRSGVREGCHLPARSPTQRGGEGTRWIRCGGEQNTLYLFGLLGGCGEVFLRIFWLKLLWQKAPVKNSWDQMKIYQASWRPFVFPLVLYPTVFTAISFDFFSFPQIGLSQVSSSSSLALTPTRRWTWGRSRSTCRRRR